MSIVALPTRPEQPPVDNDLEAWARNLILQPATTPEELRTRFIVSDLLVQVEATR